MHPRACVSQQFDTIRGPPADCTQRGNFKYRHLDADGIIPKGVRVVDGDVLVNKFIPSSSQDGGLPVRAAPLCYKGPVPGFVDQVCARMQSRALLDCYRNVFLHYLAKVPNSHKNLFQKFQKKSKIFDFFL